MLLEGRCPPNGIPLSRRSALSLFIDCDRRIRVSSTRSTRSHYIRMLHLSPVLSHSTSASSSSSSATMALLLFSPAARFFSLLFSAGEPCEDLPKEDDHFSNSLIGSHIASILSPVALCCLDDPRALKVFAVEVYEERDATAHAPLLVTLSYRQRTFYCLARRRLPELLVCYGPFRTPL